MIKANELRIGNLLYYMTALVDVKQINAGKINNGYPQEEYDPIPLTAEWLERFGLKKIDSCMWEIVHGILLRSPEQGIKWEFYKPTSPESLSGYIWGGIFSVHQLQNLYFALTGEELILKTENVG